MKHLLSILILLGFMSLSFADEQVYYCSMDQDTLLSNPDGKKLTGYKDRFTASIDFENETFVSKDLWLIKKDRSICRFYDQYNELLCFSEGGVHSISIRKDNLSYVISFLSVRAFEEGGSPIGVSYGKCEVF